MKQFLGYFPQTQLARQHLQNLLELKKQVLNVFYWKSLINYWFTVNYTSFSPLPHCYKI